MDTRIYYSIIIYVAVPADVISVMKFSKMKSFVLLRYKEKAVCDLLQGSSRSSEDHIPAVGFLIDKNIMTKTCLFKYTENFTTKNETFQIKNSDIFHISAQNIDCGYSLEPPRWGSSNEYPQYMFLSRNKKK